MKFLAAFEAFFTPFRRKWIYRTAWAISTVLTVEKVITQDEAAVYLGAIASILMLADRNVDMNPEARPGHYSTKPEKEV